MLKSMYNAAASYLKPETKTKEMGEKRLKMLDLAFAMDCTGSMGSYIHEAQENIRTICKRIVAEEDADIRLALVEYRDHPPQDRSFITKVHDFTSDVTKMKEWLDGCQANGGGDGPEAVADALDEVRQLDWRQKACKICVFIADAPPHGLGDKGSGDGFPDGCPLLIDPIECAYSLAKHSITIYMVGCEPSINNSKEFFMALCHLTGGQYVPLKNSATLAKIIIGGAQEQLSLQILLDEVEEMVLEEHQTNKDITEDELCEKIHVRLTTGPFKTRCKQLKINSSKLPGATDQAQNWAKFEKLSDLRRAYKPTSSTTVSDLDKQVGDISNESSYKVDEGEVTPEQTKRLVRQCVAKHKIKVTK